MAIASSRRLPGARYRPMSDINVTPLVDVMLVLLVVFMVTAPLLTVGVPVDLPQTTAPPIKMIGGRMASQRMDGTVMWSETACVAAAACEVAKRDAITWFPLPL